MIFLEGHSWPYFKIYNYGREGGRLWVLTFLDRLLRFPYCLSYNMRQICNLMIYG